jgi:hypothetical protein
MLRNRAGSVALTGPATASAGAPGVGRHGATVVNDLGTDDAGGAAGGAD